MLDLANAVRTALAVPGLVTGAEMGSLARMVDALSINGEIDVLEIGSYMGRTATLFANLGCSVTCIEDFSLRWVRGGGVPPSDLDAVTVRTAFFDYMRKHFGSGTCTLIPFDSVKQATAIRHLFDGDRPFNLCFIDGAHDTPTVTSDLLLCMALIADGGMICGHDSDLPPVRAALDAVLGHGNWCPPVCHIDHSNRIWWYSPSK